MVVYRTPRPRLYNAEFACDESNFVRQCACLWQAVPWRRDWLELCDFREVEVADFHGRNDHLKRLFPGGAHRWSQQFDIPEHLQNGLIEAKIANRRADPALFLQELAVARHPGHDLFIRVDFADVPQSRH